MKLYGYFRSSAAFRVRIALNIKELNYNHLPIHLTRHGGEQRQESFLTINPSGLVPVLEDNDNFLSQSLAIIEYLEELYPKPSLLPGTPIGRAQIRSIAMAIACDIHPLNNLRVLKYLEHDMGHDKTKIMQGWYQHWLQIGFNALEKTLKQTRKDSTFCFGHKPTLADVALIPQMYNARRFNFVLDAFPTLVSIEKACLMLPSFQKALPENQPDYDQ
ncbi:MAG: maleylacetoacetate isomerase [Alphaproteobacteria bacterium]|nr:maleylacetoacetate isomerase [Alphaproteobacteria bacterium]